MRNRSLPIAALLLALATRHAPAEGPTTALLASLPIAPPVAPPVAPGSRQLYSFDFEETARGNFESTPMFWSKVVGTGYPAYATGRFDHDVFRSKNSSFRLDIDGGSAAYEFIAPAGRRIPVDANADYHIRAFVRTTALHNARAEIAAWFADENGNLLAPTECHSEPFADTDSSSQAPGEWHVMHLFVPGPRANTPEAANAKSLVLQLGLLQPQQLAGTAAKPPSPLGRFELYQQDLKGTAWFDDITVFQLPRVSIEIPEQITAAIFEPGQPIDLNMTVSDLARGTPGADAPLDVALRITDSAGLLFAGQKWNVTSTPSIPWTHRYSHPPLPPGLYTATIDITDKAGGGGTLIARRSTTFMTLSAMPVRTQEGTSVERTAPEFGIDATRWPASAWKELPTVLHATDVGLLQLSAWRRDMTEETLRQRDPALDALLTMVQRSDIHVLASLAQLPSILGDKLAQVHPAAAPDDSLMALADADPALWRPYIAFLLARYSTLIDRWEFGSTTAPFSGTLRAGAPTANDPYPHLYEAAYSQLGPMLNQPRLLIPWNALFEFNPQLFPHAALDLQIPSVVKPAQIPSYIADFRAASSTDTSAGQTPGDLYVHIDPLSAQEYSADNRVADFAQRLIYSRAAAPTATLIELPLSRPGGNSGSAPRTEPDELLLPFRTIVRTLGASLFRREIPLDNGARGFLFSRDGEGVLALWSDTSADHQLSVDLPLGDAAVALDLVGNMRTLAVDPHTHLTHVPLTTMPLVLQHVDANVLAVRASFALANSTLPAGAGVLTTDILLTNPYPDSLTGAMHLELPTGWTVEPSTFPVSIPSGASFHQGVTIRYPYTESAGPKMIRGTLSAMNTGGGGGGSNEDRPLAMTTTAFIRSDTVETECFARMLPNGDLVIQQMITNLATSPLNTQAYALVPGYARQQRFVLNLLPGQTTIKRFLFPASANVDYTDKSTPATIAAALASKTASVGLRQTDGKTLITKSVPLN